MYSALQRAKRINLTIVSAANYISVYADRVLSSTDYDYDDDDDVCKATYFACGRCPVYISSAFSSVFNISSSFVTYSRYSYTTANRSSSLRYRTNVLSFSSFV